MKARYPGPRNIGILDVMRYRFPLTAIASILHRVSGILLFLLLPFLLYVLDLSLSSAEGFQQVSIVLHQPIFRCFTWVGLTALIYHTLAGLKHLMMDFGYWEERLSAKIASQIVLALGLMVAGFLGVWLW